MRHINLIAALSATLLSSTSAFASDVSNAQFESYAGAGDSDQSNVNEIGVCGGTVELETWLGNEAAGKTVLGAQNAKPDEVPQPLPGGQDQRGRHPLTPMDLSGDGIVGGADLLILMSQWGTCDEHSLSSTPCTADFNHDGYVLEEDLTLLMRAWTE